MQDTTQKIHICKECSFEIEINGHSATCSLRPMPNTIQKIVDSFIDRFPTKKHVIISVPVDTKGWDFTHYFEKELENALTEIREQTIRECIEALPSKPVMFIGDYGDCIDDANKNLTNLLTNN